MSKRSIFRRIGLGLVALVALIVIGLFVAVKALSRPLPDGEAGQAGDDLARAIEQATRKDAWDRTGAVTWFFGGRNRHLWDRERMYDRVVFGDNEVLVNLTTQTGLAFRK